MKKNSRTDILKFIKDNYSIIIVAAILIILSSAAIYLNVKLAIQPHDNLDSALTFFVAMKNSQTFFKFDGNVEILGGISRQLLYTNLSISNLIYYFLGTIWGYIAVWISKIVIGTFSFCLLLNELLGRERYSKYKNLIILIGFAYGLLWGFPLNYFSAASVPLIFFLLIQVRKTTGKKQYLYYTLVFLYPLLSRLFLYGMFICGFLVIYIIYDVSKNKCFKLLPALLLLVLGYTIAEHRYIYYIFVENAVTIKQATIVTNMSFENIISVFREGRYESESVHTYIILPLCAVFLIADNIKRMAKKESLLTITNLFAIVILFNTVVYGIYRTEHLREFVYKLVPFFNGINFGRTYYFSPILWYLLFFYYLKPIYDRTKLVAICLVIAQLSLILTSTAQYNDIRNTYKKYTAQVYEYQYHSFEEFYSESLFDEIKEQVDYDGEYSAAFRLHPGILVYNGISTIDGYHSSYLLDYKNDFRELVIDQIAQNQENLEYFDNWGGRAYLFSNDITPWSYNRHMEIDLVGDNGENLYINIDKFKQMNGVYIFSNGEILNAAEQGLKLIDLFKNSSSVYTIYVYRAD